ncbi:MAG: glucuronate isomerase [Kiritimatiellae bacterium]|nr:glucuronate isomerase [Kiritimatiellia bacterium]
MNTPPLITDDFILQTPEARTLYHEYAENQPIIDYHCHLFPKEVADDIRWENIAQPWLGGDHYKWRAMRSNGIEERFCTGDASDWEKFEKFAGAMPYMLRNPMYHWSHLELARYFDINDLLLSDKTAKEVWERTAAKLAEPDFSARGLMKKSNVKVVCTTDDPTDSLEYHAQIAADKSFDVKVLPAWRPDKGLQIENNEAWNVWVDKLSAAAGMDIATLDDFINALQKRHDFFDSMGCKLSDYGLSTVYAEKYTESEIKAIFAKARGKTACDEKEVLQFKSFMLHTCGKMDAKSDWTWQIHYNALRNNNTKMFRKLGPDTGFDSIGDWPIAEGLSKLLDGLELEDSLPRTIVYTLNPRDNELLGAMIGNFQSAPTPSKMQFGSGWWFNDQMDGMTRHIEALSQLGMLSRFVGMLTDSRSFLSYTRHEYFRRILCNILGNDMAKGIIPHDFELVGRMVADISYNNAKNYFKF